MNDAINTNVYFLHSNQEEGVDADVIHSCNILQDSVHVTQVTVIVTHLIHILNVAKGLWVVCR